jgi:hypothetical protein
VLKLKNLGIPVNDSTFEKFCAIQKKHNLKNQIDTLEYVIELAAATEQARESVTEAKEK